MTTYITAKTVFEYINETIENTPARGAVCLETQIWELVGTYQKQLQSIALQNDVSLIIGYPVNT